MKKIYRYSLDEIYSHLDLDPSHNIIRVDQVDGKWSMWAIVDPDAETKPYRIQRIQLPVKEKVELNLPPSSKLIHAQDIDGVFYLWYIFVYTEIDKFNTWLDRKLVFFKTGQPIPDNLVLSPLIGTCKLFICQELCLYLFEDLTPSAKDDTMPPEEK